MRIKLIKNIIILFILLIGFSYNYLHTTENYNGIKFDKFNLHTKIEVDSVNNNQIVQVWYSKNELNVKIKVLEKNKPIRLAVYNILGKEVLNVYEGPHNKEDDPYIRASELPLGIYICILEVNGIRNAKKFYVSK